MEPVYVQSGMSGGSAVHPHSPDRVDTALGQSALSTSTPVSKRQKRKVLLKEKLQAMEQLNALVHRRGVAKGKVTKIYHVCHTEDGTPALTEAQVKVYTRKLEAAYKEYQNAHDQIIALVPAEDRDSHDDHYDTFDDLHDEVSIILEEQSNRFNAGSHVVAGNASQLQALAVPQAPVVVQ